MSWYLHSAQVKGPDSEPAKWELRIRPRGGSSKGCSTFPPKPPAPKLRANNSRGAVQRKALRMSDDTWTANSSPNPYNDYCHDEGGFLDGTVGGFSMDPLREYSDREMEPDDEDAEQLELAIAEKELQLLTKRRALHRRQVLHQGGTSTMTDLDDMGMLRTNDGDRQARRRRALKQQQFELPGRDIPGRKRYVVEVDMKGHACGQNRSLWLTCLRGHSADIDFSVDNYVNHSTAMLLNIKQRVDNTFEYRGGLGKVTEEAFHSSLKQQLKMKRYEMKKMMVAGKEKPKHIRKDHWESLSRLISEDRKLRQSEKLKENRAQVKKVSSAGRSEGVVRANLVWSYIISCSVVFTLEITIYPSIALVDWFPWLYLVNCLAWLYCWSCWSVTRSSSAILFYMTSSSRLGNNVFVIGAT